MKPETAGVWILPTSFLYVPGNKPQLMPKALASDAEAIIFDLEDAVPANEKSEARNNLRKFCDEHLSPAKQVWVRVNSVEHLEELAQDVEALSPPAVAGVFLPKVDLDGYAQFRSLLAARSGLAEIALIGLIESARGLQQAAELARSPQLHSLGIGRVDLLADLGVNSGSDTHSFFEVLAAQVVVACAAAGIGPAVAPAMLDLEDMDDTSSTARYRALGFRSRTAIHPKQCAAINRAFTPTTEEYTEARALLEALRNSRGAFVGNDGRFVDAAVARHSQEVVRRYEA